MVERTTGYKSTDGNLCETLKEAVLRDVIHFFNMHGNENLQHGEAVFMIEHWEKLTDILAQMEHDE